MLTILEEDENLIATKISEKITAADYEKILPIITEKIQQYGKFRWYFELEDFEGWELKGLYKELNFDIRHSQDLEKIAMVGEVKWTEWLSDMMKPFTSAEMKFFEAAEREIALEWIKRP